MGKQTNIKGKVIKEKEIYYNNFMIIEIDQSGKVEQLDTDTVVAYANDDVSGVVYIKAGTKRKIITYLRRTLIPQNDLYPIFFAILVFILIYKFKSDISVKIDEEYTGKERIILETLEKLRKRKSKWRGNILFGQIGKHSLAHTAAWRVHNMKQKGTYKRISEAEILHFLP
jgi:hypothetical protein